MKVLKFQLLRAALCEGGMAGRSRAGREDCDETESLQSPITSQIHLLLFVLPRSCHHSFLLSLASLRHSRPQCESMFNSV